MFEIRYIRQEIVGAVMLGKNSSRLSAESSPRSIWMKKFSLQITFMYIYFNHYANPPKCIVYTADIGKTLDDFLYLFFWSMICQNQIEETLYPHLRVCEQFCCKILVQNGGYSLFQAQSFTLQSNPPGQHEH